jgi:hypothetical protein
MFELIGDGRGSHMWLVMADLLFDASPTKSRVPLRAVLARMLKDPD